MVISNNYIIGLPWSTKVYDFDQLSTAQFFYERLTYTKLGAREA